MENPRPLRNTAQREAILEVVRRSRSHPTAEEVFRAVRRRLPRISLATVYRNLDLLVERGELRRIDVPDGRRRFDGALEAHEHIRCVKCRRVDDMEPAPSVESVVDHALRRGYEVHGHRLDLWGLCPKCRDGKGTPATRSGNT